MKICLVSNLYNPDIIGGAENVVASLAESLSAEGHDVLVIATKQSSFVPVYEGLYHGANKSGSFYLYAEDLFRVVKNSLRNALLTPIWHVLDVWNPHSYYFVRRAIKDFAPDIINTHNIFGMSTAVWSAVQTLKIPLVHTLYDYSLLCSRTTRFKSGEGPCGSLCQSCFVYSNSRRPFAGAVSAVIAPSDHIMDVFETNGMFQTAKKYIVPNGTEKGLAKPLFKEDVVNFLCVGQISEHKGILTLINAFMKVYSKRAALNIVGLGDCLRKAEKVASGDRRIRFHHFVDADEKKTLFQNNSVLILPSLWEEPFGQAILEAYAHGMPVIASNIGALPSLVEHGETGYLVESGNEEDLTEKIELFLSSPHLASKMSDNCVKKAESFSLAKQVRQYCEIYEDVLASSRAASRQ